MALRHTLLGARPDVDRRYSPRPAANRRGSRSNYPEPPGILDTLSAVIV